MRQHQIVTSEVFDKIVNDKINLQFKLHYLTDQCLPNVYRRISEQKLKDEAYSIFFKSFDDILETIVSGIREKLKIKIYWYDIFEIIAAYKVVRENFPDADQDGEYPDTEYEIVRNFLPGIEYEETKYESEKSNMKFDSHIIYLYFYCKRQKYVMHLDSRIQIIIDYILTKNIFRLMFEASRGLRYKTLEERKHGNTIEWDMYNYTKVIGNDVSRTLKSDEEQIWQPRLSIDIGSKNTINIGDNHYRIIGA